MHRYDVARVGSSFAGLSAAMQLALARKVSAEVVSTAPRTRMASPLAEQRVSAFADSTTGSYVKVDPMRQTSVPRVFAAEDAATEMYDATLASTAGVIAWVAACRALVLKVAHGALDHP